MATKFAKTKAAFEALELQRAEMQEMFDGFTAVEIEPGTDLGLLRASLDACSTTVNSVVEELAALEEAVKKYEAKAKLFGTPQQLYNEATSKEILEFVLIYERSLLEARKLKAACAAKLSEIPPPVEAPVEPSPSAGVDDMEVEEPSTASPVPEPAGKPLIVEPPVTDLSSSAMDTSSSTASPTMASLVAITVKLIQSGGEVVVNVANTSNIADLKAAITISAQGVDGSNLIIVSNGRRLGDMDTLSSAGITSGSTVYAGNDPTKGGSNTSEANNMTVASEPAISSPDVPTRGLNTAASGTDSASTSSTSDKDKLVASMVKAVTTMKNATNHPGLVMGVKTLVKLVDNLLKNPGVEKFGRVREKNAVLKDRLLGKPGGIEALIAMGFIKTIEDGEVYYVCSKPHPAAKDVKALLDEALATLQK